MLQALPLVTFLFTDIEGSTRLWEQQPQRMGAALAEHDALCRTVVQAHRGRLVKTTGDGMHAAFPGAADALAAALALQRALADPAATGGLPLAVRCGLHLGADEARDNDFFGRDVNRAARIMSAAHGGQVLLSQAVADVLAADLPAGVSLRDLGQVRLRDLQRAERLYQVVAPPLRSEFPALRSLETTPNNLPLQLNRFIGREREMAALRDLASRERLITLAGPGGIGKTRLSMQLGAELLERYADGAWLVELAPLGDAHRLPHVVAAALGVKEAPGQPVTEALAGFVSDRQLLLILDNCEHLRQAAAALAKRLLQAGPRVAVLASSREPLYVAGERIFEVPALSVPAPDATADDEALLAHEAAQLFIDRVRAVRPEIEIRGGDALAVAEICHRVDGMPLALELAAARARALPLPVIAARLRESLTVLATQDNTLAPRQRTVHQLIDWSHELLDPAERALFRRLSVFSGGWALDDAEAVCGGEGLPASEVIDLLGSLVDKSLVQPDVERVRYRLLETIRQFAAERLAAAEGRAPALRRRHLERCLALAEAAQDQLAGPESGGWLSRLDVDRDNLSTALGWAAAARDGAEPGLRLCYALRPYWMHRGLLTMGLAALRVALKHPGAQTPDAFRARGLFYAGQLCSFLGRYDEARRMLEQSLAIVRALGDETRIPAVLQPLGIALLGLRDVAGAQACYEEAVALARSRQLVRQLSPALVALAQLHRECGRLDAAEPLYREALALARELGDDKSVVVSLINLSMVALARGQTAAVPGWLAETLARVRASGYQLHVMASLDTCVALALALGEPLRAARCHGAVRALLQRTGLRRDTGDETFVAPWLARLASEGEPEAREAAQAAGAAMAEAALLDDLIAWVDALQAGAPMPEVASTSR